MNKVWLILLVFAAFLGSCCNKVNCAFLENNTVSFAGFDSSELKQITCVTKVDSNQITLDSVVFVAQFENGKVLLSDFNFRSKNENLEYLFQVSPSNKNYILNNFKYRKEQINCNNCYQKEYADNLYSYDVNGVTKTYDNNVGFEISK